ncbi:MAG: hypothetical protein ACOY3K_02755 [Candidatus Omnitrophota bacterium]
MTAVEPWVSRIQEYRAAFDLLDLPAQIAVLDYVFMGRQWNFIYKDLLRENFGDRIFATREVLDRSRLAYPAEALNFITAYIGLTEERLEYLRSYLGRRLDAQWNIIEHYGYFPATEDLAETAYELASLGGLPRELESYRAAFVSLNNELGLLDETLRELRHLGDENDPRSFLTYVEERTRHLKEENGIVPVPAAGTEGMPEDLRVRLISRRALFERYQMGQEETRDYFLKYLRLLRTAATSVSEERLDPEQNAERHALIRGLEEMIKVFRETNDLDRAVIQGVIFRKLFASGQAPEAKEKQNPKVIAVAAPEISGTALRAPAESRAADGRATRGLRSTRTATGRATAKVKTTRQMKPPVDSAAIQNALKEIKLLRDRAKEKKRKIAPYEALAALARFHLLERLSEASLNECVLALFKTGAFDLLETSQPLIREIRGTQGQIYNEMQEMVREVEVAERKKDPLRDMLATRLKNAVLGWFLFTAYIDEAEENFFQRGSKLVLGAEQPVDFEDILSPDYRFREEHWTGLQAVLRHMRSRKLIERTLTGEEPTQASAALPSRFPDSAAYPPDLILPPSESEGQSPEAVELPPMPARAAPKVELAGEDSEEVKKMKEGVARLRARKFLKAAEGGVQISDIYDDLRYHAREPGIDLATENMRTSNQFMVDPEAVPSLYALAQRVKAGQMKTGFGQGGEPSASHYVHMDLVQPAVQRIQAELVKLSGQRRRFSAIRFMEILGEYQLLRKENAASLEEVFKLLLKDIDEFAKVGLMRYFFKDPNPNKKTDEAFLVQFIRKKIARGKLSGAALFLVTNQLMGYLMVAAYQELQTAYPIGLNSAMDFWIGIRNRMRHTRISYDVTRRARGRIMGDWTTASQQEEEQNGWEVYRRVMDGYQGERYYEFQEIDWQEFQAYRKVVQEYAADYPPPKIKVVVAADDSVIGGGNDKKDPSAPSITQGISPEILGKFMASIPQQAAAAARAEVRTMVLDFLTQIWPVASWAGTLGPVLLLGVLIAAGWWTKRWLDKQSRGSHPMPAAPVREPQRMELPLQYQHSLKSLFPDPGDPETKEKSETQLQWERFFIESAQKIGAVILAAGRKHDLEQSVEEAMASSEMAEALQTMGIASVPDRLRQAMRISVTYAAPLTPAEREQKIERRFYPEEFYTGIAGILAGLLIENHLPAKAASVSSGSPEDSIRAASDEYLGPRLESGTQDFGDILSWLRDAVPGMQWVDGKPGEFAEGVVRAKDPAAYGWHSVRIKILERGAASASLKSSRSDLLEGILEHINQFLKEKGIAGALQIAEPVAGSSAPMQQNESLHVMLSYYSENADPSKKPVGDLGNRIFHTDDPDEIRQVMEMIEAARGLTRAEVRSGEWGRKKESIEGVTFPKRGIVEPEVRGLGFAALIGIGLGAALVGVFGLLLHLGVSGGWTDFGKMGEEKMMGLPKGSLRRVAVPPRTQAARSGTSTEYALFAIKNPRYKDRDHYLIIRYFHPDGARPRPTAYRIVQAPSREVRDPFDTDSRGNIYYSARNGDTLDLAELFSSFETDSPQYLELGKKIIASQVRLPKEAQVTVQDRFIPSRHAPQFLKYGVHDDRLYVLYRVDAGRAPWYFVVRFEKTKENEVLFSPRDFYILPWVPNPGGEKPRFIRDSPGLRAVEFGKGGPKLELDLPAGAFQPVPADLSRLKRRSEARLLLERSTKLLAVADALQGLPGFVKRKDRIRVAQRILEKIRTSAGRVSVEDLKVIPELKGIEEQELLARFQFAAAEPAEKTGFPRRWALGLLAVAGLGLASAAIYRSTKKPRGPQGASVPSKERPAELPVNIRRLSERMRKVADEYGFDPEAKRLAEVFIRRFEERGKIIYGSYDIAAEAPFALVHRDVVEVSEEIVMTAPPFMLFELMVHEGNHVDSVAVQKDKDAAMLAFLMYVKGTVERGDKSQGEEPGQDDTLLALTLRCYITALESERLAYRAGDGAFWDVMRRKGKQAIFGEIREAIAAVKNKEAQARLWWGSYQNFLSRSKDGKPDDRAILAYALKGFFKQGIAMTPFVRSLHKVFLAVLYERTGSRFLSITAGDTAQLSKVEVRDYPALLDWMVSEAKRLEVYDLSQPPRSELRSSGRDEKGTAGRSEPGLFRQMFVDWHASPWGDPMKVRIFGRFVISRFLIILPTAGLFSLIFGLLIVNPAVWAYSNDILVAVTFLLIAGGPFFPLLIYYPFYRAWKRSSRALLKREGERLPHKKIVPFLGARFPSLADFVDFLDRFKGKSGRVRQGFHSFEHGLELTYLNYLALKALGYPEEALVESRVATALHDLDVRPPYTAPKVSRTLELISESRDLREILLALDISRRAVEYLIYRTDYPWTEAHQAEFAGRGEAFRGNRAESLRERAEIMQFLDKAGAFLYLAPEGPEGNWHRAHELYKEWGRGDIPDEEFVRNQIAFMDLVRADPMFDKVLLRLPTWALKNWFDNYTYYTSRRAELREEEGLFDAEVPEALRRAVLALRDYAQAAGLDTDIRPRDDSTILVIHRTDFDTYTITVRGSEVTVQHEILIRDEKFSAEYAFEKDKASFRFEGSDGETGFEWPGAGLLAGFGWERGALALIVHDQGLHNRFVETKGDEYDDRGKRSKIGLGFDPPRLVLGVVWQKNRKKDSWDTLQFPMGEARELYFKVPQKTADIVRPPVPGEAVKPYGELVKFAQRAEPQDLVRYLREIEKTAPKALPHQIDTVRNILRNYRGGHFLAWQWGPALRKFEVLWKERKNPHYGTVLDLSIPAVRWKGEWHIGDWGKAFFWLALGSGVLSFMSLLFSVNPPADPGDLFVKDIRSQAYAAFLAFGGAGLVLGGIGAVIEGLQQWRFTRRERGEAAQKSGKRSELRAKSVEVKTVRGAARTIAGLLRVMVRAKSRRHPVVWVDFDYGIRRSNAVTGDGLYFVSESHYAEADQRMQLSARNERAWTFRDITTRWVGLSLPLEIGDKVVLESERGADAIQVVREPAQKRMRRGQRAEARQVRLMGQEVRPRRITYELAPTYRLILRWQRVFLHHSIVEARLERTDRPDWYREKFYSRLSWEEARELGWRHWFRVLNRSEARSPADGFLYQFFGNMPVLGVALAVGSGHTGELMTVGGVLLGTAALVGAGFWVFQRLLDRMNAVLYPDEPPAPSRNLRGLQKVRGKGRAEARLPGLQRDLDQFTVESQMGRTTLEALPGMLRRIFAKGNVDAIGLPLEEKKMVGKNYAAMLFRRWLMFRPWIKDARFYREVYKEEKRVENGQEPEAEREALSAEIRKALREREWLRKLWPLLGSSPYRIPWFLMEDVVEQYQPADLPTLLRLVAKYLRERDGRKGVTEYHLKIASYEKGDPLENSGVRGRMVVIVPADVPPSGLGRILGSLKPFIPGSRRAEVRNGPDVRETNPAEIVFTEDGRFQPIGKPILILVEDRPVEAENNARQLSRRLEGYQIVVTGSLSSARTALQIAQEVGTLKMVITDDQYPPDPDARFVQRNGSLLAANLWQQGIPAVLISSAIAEDLSLWEEQGFAIDKFDFDGFLDSERFREAVRARDFSAFIRRAEARVATQRALARTKGTRAEVRNPDEAMRQFELEVERRKPMRDRALREMLAGENLRVKPELLKLWRDEWTVHLPQIHWEPLERKVVLTNTAIDWQKFYRWMGDYVRNYLITPVGLFGLDNNALLLWNADTSSAKKPGIQGQEDTGAERAEVRSGKPNPISVEERLRRSRLSDLRVLGEFQAYDLRIPMLEFHGLTREELAAINKTSDLEMAQSIYALGLRRVAALKMAAKYIPDQLTVLGPAIAVKKLPWEVDQVLREMALELLAGSGTLSAEPGKTLSLRRADGTWVSSPVPEMMPVEELLQRIAELRARRSEIRKYATIGFVLMAGYGLLNIFAAKWVLAAWMIGIPVLVGLISVVWGVIDETVIKAHRMDRMVQATGKTAGLPVSENPWSWRSIRRKWREALRAVKGLFEDKRTKAARVRIAVPKAGPLPEGERVVAPPPVNIPAVAEPMVADPPVVMRKPSQRPVVPLVPEKHRFESFAEYQAKKARGENGGAEPVPPAMVPLPEAVKTGTERAAVQVVSYFLEDQGSPEAVAERIVLIVRSGVAAAELVEAVRRIAVEKLKSAWTQWALDRDRPLEEMSRGTDETAGLYRSSQNLELALRMFAPYLKQRAARGEGSYAVAFSVPVSRPFWDALEEAAPALGISKLILTSAMARGLSREKIAQLGIPVESVRDPESIRLGSLGVDNKALGVVQDEAGEDFRNEALIAVGIDPAGIEADPFMKETEYFIEIVTADYIARHVGAPADLGAPEKLQALMMGLFTEVFLLRDRIADYQDLISYKQGVFRLDRRSLDRLLAEYASRAEVRQSA